VTAIPFDGLLAVARVVLGPYRQVRGDLTVFFLTRIRNGQKNTRSKALNFSSFHVRLQVLPRMMASTLAAVVRSAQG